MSTLSDTQFPERLSFFNGQRLFAEDLNSLEEFNREMRWLHNFSLHQPGVGKGFAVSGEEGAREVTVGPGYAIDALGREIAMNKNLTLQVPPVADDGNGEPVLYDLAVTYPDDDDLDEAQTRSGICHDPGTIRLTEKPNFCWIELNSEGEPINDTAKSQMESGMIIRLARITVFNCQLKTAVSVTERRNARPEQRTYVAAGATSKALTAWEPWIISGRTAGAEVLVDTSSGGFITTPTYQAHIVGNRIFMDQSSGTAKYVIDGTVSVSEASPTGFKLSVYLPMLRDPDLKKALVTPVFTWEQKMTELLQMNMWHVVWMGVEG